MADHYAVIGNPVDHSKSPQIHAAFARQTGEDIVYSALLAPLARFRETVAEFRAAGGKGLNVTLPFKLEAVHMSDVISERARLAGAANFLRFDDTGIAADNTDGAGLVRDLGHNLGIDLGRARILLIGAGGAALGVALPLLHAAPPDLVMVNRTAEKALALAGALVESTGRTRLEAGGLSSVSGRQFDLVINATSASLVGETPALPAEIFAAGSIAYDLMYADGPTSFMKFALSAGASRAVDGLGMLVEQAAESFFLWRGIRPETGAVRNTLRPR